MTKRSIVAIHPTTPAQQGFIFATLTNPRDALFVEQVVVPLRGPVDRNRFDAAVDQLVARHEILRTAFVWDLADAPRQVVLDAGGVRVQVEHRDLTDKSVADITDQILAQHRADPFDPAKPPLLRLALLACGPQEHLLVWSNHHLILDGWSQIALVHEVMDVYDDGSVPAPVPAQFGAYAKWLTGRDPSRDRGFWREHFRGYTLGEPLAVRPVPEGGRFGTREAIADEQVEAGLRRISRLAGVTTATVVNAAWLLAMSRLTGTDDVVVGLSIAGRPAEFAHAPQMAGPFAVTVPFRAPLDRSRLVVGWLPDLHRSIAEVIAHDDGMARDLAEVVDQRADRPLYDSIVAYSNYPMNRADDAERRLTADLTNATAYGGRTNHALTLVAYQLQERRFRLVNDRARVPDDIAAEALNAMLDILRSAESWDDRTRLDDVLLGVKVHTLTKAEPLPPPSGSGTADFGHAEMVVANIFRDLFGLPSCHPDDDFIQLGGHSLLAVKLLDALQRAFSVDLTMSDLLRARTPRGMALRVRELLGVARIEMESLPEIVAQPSEATEPFPMTQIQQAYWVGRQAGFDLNGVDSHIYGEVDVPDLDVVRFERAWAVLIRRHPMLRSVATPDGRMRVLPAVPEYHVTVADLRDSSTADDSCVRIRQRLSHIRRDTTQWPLFTIEAAELPGGITRLFLSFDLLIGDAHSWRVLYHELVSLHDEPERPLPAIDITFRDYVLALRDLRESSTYADAREYWHERIAQLPPPPELPVVRSPGDGQEHRFVRRRLQLPAEDVALLRRCAADLGVTVSVLLLGVFSEVLGRFTGSQRFLVNVTIFNRVPLHPHVDSLVGDFTSLLMEAVDLTAAPTVAERVRALQRLMWADLDHRLYSGLEVLRDIGVRDGRRTTAVAPVVFTSTVENSLASMSDADPLRGEIVYAIGQTPQVLFDYQTYLVGGRLVINWDTVDHFFPDGYLDEMFATHSDALSRMLRDPDTMRGERLIEPYSAAVSEPVATDYDLLHQPFLDRVRMAPDDVAVVATDRRLTYRETLLQAIHIAHQIRAAGGDGLVMIYMEKGWEQVVGTLGVLLAGRAFLPADAGWPAGRVESYASFGGCDIVLTQHQLAQKCVFGPGVRVICVDYQDAAIDAEIPINAATGTDLAYVIFTSGSTGKPKGVMIEHRSALNTILDVNLRFAIGSDDSVLAISPLAFDLSIYDVFGLLAAGGRVILPAENQRRDPSGWLGLIRNEGITIWNSVPVLMDLLTAHSAGSPGDPLGSLRLCMLSGDWIPLRLPDEVRRQAPLARVASLGGATEASIWSILYEVHEVEPTWPSIPYGRSMTGQSVQVLAADYTPTPAWVPGEVFISGIGLARGYWAAPELTKAAFVIDERTGSRLYRTGDWGRLRPDGNIEFLGRRDGQVKIGGHRIELREIERVVELIDGVDQAVVVAPGTGIERRLVGYFVGRRTEVEVRDAVELVLPPYMVPARLVRLEALPLSATGKVDRSAILARADASETWLAQAGSVRDVSRDLAEIVAEFVGADIAPDADLLQFGMNSIDVIRLCNALDATFGVRPDIEAFYRDPTLRGLACLLSDRHAPSPGAAPADAAPVDLWASQVRLEDPAERAAFRSARRTLTATADGLLPATHPADMRRRRERRTHTSFSHERVSLEQISALLESLRCVDLDGQARYLHPSAGGLYGVRTFLYAASDRIVGMREGIYYYHPEQHDLAAVVSDLCLSPSLHAGTVNRETAGSAAFTLFLLADPTDYGPLYGADARHLATLDAGYMGQLLCESARPAGLELCPMHGYQFERLRWIFPAGDRISLLHLLVGGRPREDDQRVTAEGK